MVVLIALVGSWFAFALALGVVVVWPIGALLSNLLPQSQRMLPPRVARYLLLFGAMVLMAPAGCRTGALAAAMHVGDRAAALEAPATPWPTAVLAANLVRDESRSFFRVPATPMDAGRLAARLWFDDWWDLAELTFPILRAHRSTASYADTWATARPGVERALHRAIVATYIMTAFLAVLSLMAVALLFLLIRIETLRVQHPSNP